MKIKFLLFLFFLSIVNFVGAQKKQNLDILSVVGPIAINKPLIVDSLDLKSNKFTDNSLLNFRVNYPQNASSAREIVPGESDFFYLAKPSEGFAFYLLSFYVKSDFNGEGKITVKSPERFQIFVDGKKMADKTSVEDSLSLAKEGVANFKTNMSSSKVLIKYLASSDNKTETGLNIAIESLEKDSTLIFETTLSDKRRAKFVDVMDGKRVYSSSMSPSGNYVLLRFIETLPGGKRINTNEVYDVKNKRTVLQEDSQNKSGLRWMPKSELLCYFADSDKGYSMFLYNPANGNIKRHATDLPKESFSIAPDEESMYYMTREVVNAGGPKGFKRHLGIDDRQSHYRNRYFNYRYTFKDGLSQQITFGNRSVYISDISPDSKKLLFSVSEESLSQRPFRTSTSFILDLETMKTDTLWKDQKYLSGGRFSPDGSKLLILGGGESFNNIGLNIKEGQTANSYDTQAYIYDLTNGNVDPITKDFNPKIESYYWSEVENCIYFKTEDKDCINVYRYSLKNRKFTKLALDEEVVRSFSVSRKGAMATYTGSSTSNSSRAYLVNLKNMKTTLLADPMAERINNLELADVNTWNFTSSGGSEIEGRFYLPPGFDPNKKYPMIVYYYAGTAPTQRTFEHPYPLHVYAANGYVVYTLNPSGTTGFGQEFAARHVNAWGQITADEIIEGTKKFVAEHPFVNEKKIGCIGASYGGFMTQYLQTQTDLFAAAISHAGISALSSYWGEGFWGYAYSGTASADSYPWNNPDMYVKQSPLFNADKIKTPLLLLHGTVDTNVPVGESMQMYTALKLLGKTVEFIQIEGENHGIADYTKRLNWSNTIAAWFDKWLKDDSRPWDTIYPVGK